MMAAASPFVFGTFKISEGRSAYQIIGAKVDNYFEKLRADNGGILCHAAIVSREYGIPAIVCCKDAMSKIRDGQTITIDGCTGVVDMKEGE